jgi:hypothetical protein
VLDAEEKILTLGSDLFADVRQRAAAQRSAFAPPPRPWPSST